MNKLLMNRNKQKKNVEYLSFTQILNNYEVPYSIDSGVLLALMREGKLFDNEKDIDIQMWIENEKILYDILPVFKSEGYNVTIWCYKGLVYQYRFLHPHKIPVHIMFFRRYGDWAWCPASKAIGNPFSFRGSQYIYFLFNGVRRRVRNKLVTTDISRWPWNVRRVVATWWIPAHFFDHIIYDENFEVFIPEKWDEYLQFRYGNWKISQENWDFWREDGAVVHQKPDQMVNWPDYSPGGEVY